MRFKPPGGDLNWITPLLLVCGVLVSWDAARREAWTMLVLYAGLSVFLLLTWFDFRKAAWPIIIYFSFAIIVGTISLFVVEFSWLQAGKYAWLCYVVYEFYKWQAADAEIII